MPLAEPTASFAAFFPEGAPATGATGGSQGQSLPWLRRAFPKYTLAEVEVKTNRELCKDSSQGSVRHIEFRVEKDGKVRAPDAPLPAAASYCWEERWTSRTPPSDGAHHPPPRTEALPALRDGGRPRRLLRQRRGARREGGDTSQARGRFK